MYIIMRFSYGKVYLYPSVCLQLKNPLQTLKQTKLLILSASLWGTLWTHVRKAAYLVFILRTEHFPVISTNQLSTY